MNSYFDELRVASFFESWDEGEFFWGARQGGGCRQDQTLFKLGFLKKKVKNILAKLNPKAKDIFPK